MKAGRDRPATGPPAFPTGDSSSPVGNPLSPFGTPHPRQDRRVRRKRASRQPRLLRDALGILEADNGRAPSERLWHHTSEELSQLFNSALERLKIDHLHIVRYTLRHALASADILHHRRSLEEVRCRFRHRSDTSTKRHTKAARIQKFMQQFPKPVLLFGKQAWTQLPSLFQGTALLRPPSE